MTLRDFNATLQDRAGIIELQHLLQQLFTLGHR